MRALRRTQKWSIAIVGMAALGTFVGVASASLGSGFTPTNFVTANVPNEVRLNADGIKFRTKGSVDVRVQKIIIAARGVSGWHHHPGMVIVSVESGAVTFTNADCSSTTYGPGSAFIESGDDPGQASSDNGAVVYATFVAPQATPPVFRIEDAPQPQPCVPPTDDDNGDGGGQENH